MGRSKERRNKTGKVRYDVGDAIRGEIILARARKWDQPSKVADSGGHNIQQGKLQKEAFAIVEKKFRHIP